MDANKLKVFQDIDYEIKRVCGNCKFYIGNDTPGRHQSSLFSSCLKHVYFHQKHTQSKRELSVHATGTCEQHEWNERIVGFMHAYADLREE